MQDANIQKMSEMADTEIQDTPTMNILLCYLLYKMDRPVSPDQLYEIAISTGFVNYFCYQESIDFLISNEHITTDKDENGSDVYVLLQKGKACAKELKNYAPKSYRDKLVLAALRYFTRLKYEQEIKIEYIPLAKGCYVHLRCLDVGDDLMELKLYAPNREQAELIGKRIMLNPAGFYGKLIDLALSNEEVSYDLTDN